MTYTNFATKLEVKPARDFRSKPLYINYFYNCILSNSADAAICTSELSNHKQITTTLVKEILECVTHCCKQVLEVTQHLQDAKIRTVPHFRKTGNI